MGLSHVIPEYVTLSCHTSASTRDSSQSSLDLRLHACIQCLLQVWPQVSTGHANFSTANMPFGHKCCKCCSLQTGWQSCMKNGSGMLHAWLWVPQFCGRGMLLLCLVAHTLFRSLSRKYIFLSVDYCKPRQGSAAPSSCRMTAATATASCRTHAASHPQPCSKACHVQQGTRHALHA